MCIRDSIYTSCVAIVSSINSKSAAKPLDSEAPYTRNSGTDDNCGDQLTSEFFESPKSTHSAITEDPLSNENYTTESCEQPSLSTQCEST